jgi:PAS domain S-box-containing protein
MRHGLLEPALLQRMLYDTLDHSDDIVVILEQVGADAMKLDIVSVNDAFSRASGFGHAELIQQPLSALIAGDNDRSRWNDIVRAAQDGGSENTELLCRRKNGLTFWLGLHLMPVRDSSPPRFVILGRDITESRHMRQQQAAIQGLLAKVFLCVQAPVAIVSDTGVIQMANPALDDLLGHPAGGLAGKPAIDCIAPGMRQALAAARERQAENGQDYTLAARLLHTNGSEVPVEITSITVQRDDLRRFRIVTVLKLAEDVSPVAVHVAAKIKLIGLDEVKEALGARWAKVAARAMASAEHVILHRCGSRDTWSRTADASFLICFADAVTEEAAAFRAAAMAREIRRRLIGDGETETTAEVSAIAASVDLPHVPGVSVDMLAAAIDERLSARLAQIETQARETLRHAVQTTHCRLELVRSGGTREVVAHFARLPDEQEQRIMAAYSTLPINERQGFDFDRLVLGVAAEQVISEIAVGGALLVLVNVDFEVFLDSRRTERYVVACQALDSRLRERLVLVLSGMPRGFPKSRVAECVMRLRPFCHGVGFRSDSMEAPSVEFSLLGAAIVVLHADRQTPTDFGRLANLIESLHAHQARVLVRHFAAWEDAMPLVRLGVDLVSLVSDERDTVDRLSGISQDGRDHSMWPE